MSPTVIWRAMRFRVAGSTLWMILMHAGAVAAAWDGSTSLHDINLKPENFLDINSFQFRPSEEIRWYGVENGWRIAGGSLESNRAYLKTDLRLKQLITPSLSARLYWADNEFYEPRQVARPLLELELRPSAWPLSFSLLGAPAYAKPEADLGLAITLGMRPWDYVRVAWLSPDHYYNSKNDFDRSYYLRNPSQLTVDAAHKWDERYKLRLLWQDNSPLEFVLDDQISVFAYENRNYQGSFDYQRDTSQTFGIAMHGFDTKQSSDAAGTFRSQDIRYYSVNSYWIRSMGLDKEWTIGIRHDAFRNAERTPLVSATEYDYVLETTQLYSTYYVPFASQQAWDLGLYLGHSSERRSYLDASIDRSRENYFEAKLRTGWEVFSSGRGSALTLALSWNLDNLVDDTFDGGSVRFRAAF